MLTVNNDEQREPEIEVRVNQERILFTLLIPVLIDEELSEANEKNIKKEIPEYRIMKETWNKKYC